LIEELDKTASLPGWRSAWTAPARARMDMMATGVRTPVGIRVVSPDPQRLQAIGAAVRGVVGALPGTRSAVFEGTDGETWLSFDPGPAALARFGVDRAAVQNVVDLVATGGQVGEIRDENGRLLRVRI